MICWYYYSLFFMFIPKDNFYDICVYTKRHHFLNAGFQHSGVYYDT